MNNEQVINAYIRRVSKLDWELLNRTDKGIQIKQIKKVKMLGFWVGLLLIPFWGIGFILWLLVLIEYVLRREKIMFISIDKMIEQLKVVK